MIPENYQPVEERLAKFWEKHPDGRIETELVSPPQNFEQCRYVARVWKSLEPYERPADATGWAFEIAGGNGANRTNHEENCETSAIGRALANLGFAPLGARPSREEMSKTTRGPAPRAERQQQPQGNVQQAQHQQQRPQAGPGAMTEAQGKRLWVLAKNQNMSEDDTRAQVFLRFGKLHIHEMTKREASELMDFIEAGDLLQGSVPPPPRADPQEANQQGMGGVPDDDAAWNAPSFHYADVG